MVVVNQPTEDETNLNNNDSNEDSFQNDVSETRLQSTSVLETASVIATCCLCANMFGTLCLSSFLCLLDGNCAGPQPSASGNEKDMRKRTGGGFAIYHTHHHDDNDDENYDGENGTEDSWTTNPFDSSPFVQNSNSSPFDSCGSGHDGDCGGGCDGGDGGE
ncbi:hypothetical protein CHUAL_002217 [Chamberlinius hualienensis]